MIKIYVISQTRNNQTLIWKMAYTSSSFATSAIENKLEAQLKWHKINNDEIFAVYDKTHTTYEITSIKLIDF